MTFKEQLVNLGIDNNEFLNKIKGSYQPGFMQIYLEKPYNGNLDDLSISELGTFLHEYIHYLQNISTPWGLFSSMVWYNAIVETYSYIQSTETIHLPINIDYSDSLKHKIQIISLGNGDNPLSGNNNNKIDRNKDIIWQRRIETLGNKQIKTIKLTVPIIDGSQRDIILGANIINESMAALYQMQIDSSALHPDNDLPYNLVKILAEQKFVQIANDDIKLITICYLSLFSLSPAVTLIDQLDFANQNPNYSAQQLFDYFMENGKIHINSKESISVEKFFDDLIERFKIVLYSSIRVELDYINETLNRVKLSNKCVPIISVLYSGSLTTTKIKTLIDFLGMPYTYTNEGEYHYPKSVVDTDKESNDMIALIGHSSLFSYLVYPNIYHCCPLKYICSKENVDKEECFDRPWTGKECVMTVMGNLLGLDKKSIQG